MGLLKLTTIALWAGFIAACSAPEPPTPPQKTVFDPLIEQENRAKNVQTTVDEQAAKQRQQVDSQERGDPPP